MKTSCLKVLLDNSIVSAAEIAESATKQETLLWGDIQQTLEVVGYRKKVVDDTSLQEEIDAITTIGRLIREQVVAAYTYNELRFESFRRSTPIKAFNALSGCAISNCAAPIERSKFRQTVDFSEYVSKGGKKDKRRNGGMSDFNQISFLEWLVSLDEQAVRSILTHAKEINLTEFEVESLRQLDWFRFICSRFGSPENYPDAFHLWTAERNRIDVFLTLEKKLPNTVEQIVQSKNHKHQIRTSVLRPIAFLQSMGISDCDDPPIEADRFYDFMHRHKSK